MWQKSKEERKKRQKGHNKDKEEISRYEKGDFVEVKERETRYVAKNRRKKKTCNSRK
jgi:hypothetical protein